MMNLKALWASRVDWFSSAGQEQNIKDYIALSNQLVRKRQASMLAAAILSAIYFDALSIFAFYLVVALTEVLDLKLAREAQGWDGEDTAFGEQIFRRIVLNTVISAVAISVFIMNIALQQTSSGHFTPLFFLFSASIFAAMYNSQMMGILILRLSIYSFAFLFMAFLDVFRFQPPLGSRIWLEFFTIIFVLYFIGDIAAKFYLNYQERLRQMDQIREENERSKSALEAKSRFLATVSHELRTPLTSIIGSLELIRSGKIGTLPDTVEPVLDIASRNGQRLAALIEDLLDVQRVEAGEMVFSFKPLDVNHLLSEAVDSISGYATKLGVRVTLHLSAEACYISGDRNRLNQVLGNILSNALKFSIEGGTVTARVERVGDRIRISIQDEGSGIPEGVKDRVFGKFTQVDSSDIRKVGGTGLGLYISKQIVESHNATLDYVSELGVGTTFYLDFDPLRDADNSGQPPHLSETV
jgi:Signal transduction histidine kinase